jgi:hypothetical protein
MAEASAPSARQVPNAVSRSRSRWTHGRRRARPSGPRTTPAKSWHISSSAAGRFNDRCPRRCIGHGRVGGERGIRPSAPWVLGVSRLLISLRRQVQLCRRYGYRSVYRIDGGPDEVRAEARAEPPPACHDHPGCIPWLAAATTSLRMFCDHGKEGRVNGTCVLRGAASL